ncbi:YncE family protein [Amycolatopsis ultiminotia]|uniref:YncE family protein n=1 Tax=Amycolatopsis ultiminotia TaxID=543629 RepID=A0ABP6V9V6_9PSEU
MTSTTYTAGTLLVSSSTAKNLDFFDLRSGRKLGTITDLLAEPHEIAYDAGRRRAYIAHTYRHGVYDQDVPKSHEITVVNVDDRAVESVIDIAPYHAPHDVEYDPELDLIITGVENLAGRRGVVLINATTHEIEAGIATDARNCHWLALVPGRKVYVTHKEAPIISVIDLVGRRLEGSIEVPGGAEEIDAAPEGDFVYAVTPRMPVEVDLASGHFFRPEPQPGDPVPRIVKIDVETNAVIDEIQFGNHQMGIRAGCDGRVYASSMNNRVRPGPEADLSALPRTDGVLNILDATDMSLVGTVTVDALPMTIRVSPDNATAWVASLATGRVAVVDVAGRRRIADLDNNAGGSYGGTHGMVLVP